MNRYGITEQHIGTDATAADVAAYVAYLDRLAIDPADAAAQERAWQAWCAASGNADAAVAAMDGERTVMQSLRAMALDDNARAIARNGVTLTHADVEDLGEEVIDWMRRRLDLTDESDADGVAFRPR